MESEEVLLSAGNLNGGFVSNGNGLEVVNGGNGFELVNRENGLEHVVGDEMGNNSLADEVLEDLEEYWEDINDRLMISRMVGDSVIKGMAMAVEQDAAEKIRAKELEVLIFKDRLRSLGVGIGEFEPVRLPEQKACEVGNSERFLSFTDMEHDKMREDLHTFRNEAREQLEEAKQEIVCARGSSAIEKISSNSELVGLSGILSEKRPKCWLNLDDILENLKSSVDTLCTKMDSILLSSKTCLYELQHEIEMSRNIEDIVTRSVLKSVQEEFEGNWTEQKAQYCNIKSVNWLEKFNDMSSLRTQLDLILKSLSISEAGLVSHGSHDLDNSPHKATLHTVVSFSEENGTLEASDIHVAESYDFLQLKHMSREELVNYFNNIIINLKRDHESALQKKTEKYFLLKREYLKHRRSFSMHRKDEEFDVLRKRIPEVILKLEDFLSVCESFPALLDHIESIEKLNDRVEGLLSKNRELRDCLANKENEVKRLKSEVSGAVGKLLDHSLASKSMGKLVADLKSSVEDSRLEASLNEEVYKCALRELIKQKTSDHEDSSMKFLKAASYTAVSRGKYEIEDSDIESSIVQGLSALMFKEAIKNVEGKLINLHQGVLIEKQNRINLERKVIENENQLRLDVNEKERLEQEILSLGTTMEQKQKLAVELSISLSKEREKFELASGELSSLRKNLSQQQSLVSETNRQCESLSAKLLEATEQIDVDKAQIHKINEKLDQTKDLLTEANKERNMAFALAQDRLDKLLLSEAREEKLKKEIELSIDHIHGLTKIFDNFDDRISRAISKNNLRLENATSQLTDLTKIAGVLRRTELMYKHKLERSSADLKMAESEVDLLGDEVDALLRLLEKIYIALDHYSPILKHYPGIIEILKLVRRELSGETTKLSRLTPRQG